jgi:hypothetical protein
MEDAGARGVQVGADVGEVVTRAAGWPEDESSAGGDYHDDGHDQCE